VDVTCSVPWLPWLPVGVIRDVEGVQSISVQDLIPSWGAASCEASRQVAPGVGYAQVGHFAAEMWSSLVLEFSLRFHSILLTLVSYSAMSIKFPMYRVSTFVLLTRCLYILYSEYCYL
jgi:hypothetical protein